MPPQTLEQYRQAFEANALSSAQFTALLDKVSELSAQVQWFKNQLFGAKSERRLIEPDAQQGVLGIGFVDPDEQQTHKTRTVAAHTRSNSTKPQASDEQSGALFFDESKVPVEVIELPAPEAAGLAPDQYEIIGHKNTHRLAQRPGSFVVLKYVRPVIKLRHPNSPSSTSSTSSTNNTALACAPAPGGVLEGSRADVSFIAAMMIDKLVYHLPLYRQHQRLTAAGVRVSRQWLTQLMQQSAQLLAPIFDAQLQGVLASRVKAMDETPIKAGPSSSRPGKMKAAYLWPLYGEQHEICFLYYPDRSGANVRAALGIDPVPGGVLLTDGYAAYAQYAQQVGLTHAQCWAHTRRYFFNARDIEPQAADEALELIGQLYKVEEDIRARGLGHADTHAQRQAHAKPQVEAFFKWAKQRFERQELLPSSPLTKALDYALERREGLSVYLNDPEVAIDTNHLERALRAIPMGRKNWLFCWTELGAQHIGQLQSLLVTCRLHDIDPYDYLVDVLQRVSVHPASKVEELTPRLWKSHFADNPLRSHLHQSAR